MGTGRAVSAPFDHGRPVRMELAFVSITYQRHQVQRQSFLVFAPDHEEAAGLQADH